MSRPPADPTAVVDRLAASAKYRSVAKETIALIVAGEVSRARDGKDLERRAREVLHRAAALYLNRTSPAALMAELTSGRLDGADDDAVRVWCRNALAQHDSAEERLADLDDMYPTIFGLVGDGDGLILDLACALNPLTLPWLRDVSPAAYVGVDFNERFVELGTAFAAATSDTAATFVHTDVLAQPGDLRGATALLLKTFHCIENRRRGAALELVAALSVRAVVVSFPTRSLGGRRAGFDDRYGPELRDLAESLGWTVRTGTLPTESIWVVDKTSV